jgi:hypothetical protein
MHSIIVSPKSNREFQLLSEMLLKMKFRFKTISEEFKEDLVLAELMKEADRTKKVKKSTIIKKLFKKI